jgi:hypothetical protein
VEGERPEWGVGARGDHRVLGFDVGLGIQEPLHGGLVALACCMEHLQTSQGEGWQAQVVDQCSEGSREGGEHSRELTSLFDSSSSLLELNVQCLTLLGSRRLQRDSSSFVHDSEVRANES